MSTLNVANISDDQSTLTGANENPNDALNKTTTVDTKFVTNGCTKAYANWGSDGSTSVRESLNLTSITDTSTGTYTLNYTNAFTNNGFSNSGACGVGINAGNYFIMTLFGGAPTASSVSVRTIQAGSTNSQTGLAYNGLNSHGELA